jgi:hypothetical protein
MAKVMVAGRITYGVRTLVDVDENLSPLRERPWNCVVDVLEHLKRTVRIQSDLRFDEISQCILSGEEYPPDTVRNYEVHCRDEIDTVAVEQLAKAMFDNYQKEE